MSLTDGLIGLWGMEDTTDRRDASAAGNILTEDVFNDVPRSVDPHQGNYSAGPFSTSFLIRNDSDLSSTFPAKSGGSGTAFTIGFWAKVLSSTTMQLITKGSGKIESWWDTGNRWNGYVGGKQIISSADKNINEWHHVVLRYDGTTFHCFFDNVKSSGQTGIASLANTSEFVVGGFDIATHGFPFNGYVDEAFVYDRAISDAEVSEIYTNELVEHNITNFEGFEDGNLRAASRDPGDPGIGGSPTIDGTIKHNGDYSLRIAPPGTGVEYVKLPIAYGADGRRDNTDWNFVIVDFWVRFSQFPSTTQRFLTFGRGDDANPGSTVGFLQIFSNGTISHGTTQAVSPTVLSLDTWYRIGASWHYGSDERELKINGVTEVYIGLAVPNPIDAIMFGRFTAAAGTPFNANYDNIQIESSNVQAEIGWPPEAVVRRMDPVGVGSFDQWPDITGGSENWEVTDETPNDGDTSFIRSPGSIGNRSLVTLQTPSQAGIQASEVLAVKNIAMFKGQTASSQKVVLKSGTTLDVTTGAVTTWTLIYFHLGRVHRLNPDTGLPWLLSDLLSIEAGVEDNDVIDLARVTQMGVNVLYVESIGGAQGIQMDTLNLDAEAEQSVVLVSGANQVSAVVAG